MIGRASLVAAIALVVIAPAAGALTGWRVVKTGSASGEFAIKSISADIKRPNAIAVRLTGRVDNGTAVVSCSKSFGVASWSRDYSKAGLFRLPMTPRAESCLVVASVAGSGRVGVQILKR